MLPVTTLQETAWFNKLKEIVSQISVYQFGICHTSKVILPHVLENTSLVLVSPPHYIMPYVEIEILNVTIYVSLVACMSVGRVLTHTDICACLIRVRGTTWAWPNPLRLPYPCCHTLLYTPQTITPCPYWSILCSGFTSQLIRDLPPNP